MREAAEYKRTRGRYSRPCIGTGFCAASRLKLLSWQQWSRSLSNHQKHSTAGKLQGAHSQLSHQNLVSVRGCEPCRSGGQLCEQPRKNLTRMLVDGAALVWRNALASTTTKIAWQGLCQISLSLPLKPCSPNLHPKPNARRASRLPTRWIKEGRTRRK